MREYRADIVGWADRWRWVCLYVVLIFATSPLVGSLTGSAYRSLGTATVGTLAFLLLIIAAAVVLVVLLGKARNYPWSFRISALLVALSYAATIPRLGDVSIEKIHFVEYGLLSYLVYAGFKKRSSANPFWKTLSVVFVVGFADEVYQGFLPNRRYDDLDVLMNLVSGLQGLLVTLLVREKGLGSLREGLGRRELVPYHGLWVSAGILYAFIHAVSLPTEEVRGTWHRIGNCKVEEWIRMDPSGSFSWWDAAGGRAHGRYRLSANRLEGLYLHLRVVGPVENPRKCSLRPGLSIAAQVAVGSDRIVYLKDPERSWERLALPAPEPGP